MLVRKCVYCFILHMSFAAAVLERVASEHPHFVLYQLFALANVGGATQASMDGDKVAAASGRSCIFAHNSSFIKYMVTALLERLRHKHSKIVDSFETLVRAYIELAFVDAKSHKYKKEPIPMAQLQLQRIRDLRAVPVPTLRAEPGASMPHVMKFTPTYSLVGGINLPKIVECIGAICSFVRLRLCVDIFCACRRMLTCVRVVGSDGRAHRQLVKANDDLRQDAVMQQIFALVNVLLREDQDTRKRQLTIRSYRVVPLTANCGILEWVTNTLPIGGIYMSRCVRAVHAKGSH